MSKRSGRTLPCKICGKPYTDHIDPRVDPEKGGYIICALCSMGLSDSVTIHKEHGQLNFEELVDAIQNKKLHKFRTKYGFTQSQLARRLGISTRHLRRMENNAYIPDSKVLRKIEIKLNNVLSA